jgi:hypothetical protein
MFKVVVVTETPYAGVSEVLNTLPHKIIKEEEMKAIRSLKVMVLPNFWGVVESKV